MVWMAGPPGPRSGGDVWPDLTLFFSLYALLVLLLGLWSRLLARRVAVHSFHRSLRRFNQVMFAARVVVPGWFAVGVWYLGWGALIAGLRPGLYHNSLGLLLGTAPAFAAWMGLWWSQYPADRALREQNILTDLESGLPLYQPPPFRSYFLTNLRLQVLFTMVPVLMIVMGRDLLLWIAGHWMTPSADRQASQTMETAALMTAAVCVFLFSPALLRRVLKTSRLPGGPLRERLDALCERAGVRYRQILVWHTHNHVGNAAVMGVLPWVRYVLLSDVLLERMKDEEIEAVFAHELGHIVHRHMTWYAVFFVMLLLLAGVAVKFGGNIIPALNDQSGTAGLLMLLGMMAVFLLLFGALSRRCERQADVFAARTMESLKREEPVVSEALMSARQLVTVGAGPLAPPRGSEESYVGRYGAWLFASALRRVAAINNISILPRGESEPGAWNRAAHWLDGMVETANNWLHGSIASRMQYLQDLSADPRLTGRFDRAMFWLYCGLLLALFTSVACAFAGPL